MNDLTMYQPIVVDSWNLTSRDLLCEDIQNDIRQQYDELAFKHDLRFMPYDKALAQAVATVHEQTTGMVLRELFTKLGPVCIVVIDRSADVAELRIQAYDWNDIVLNKVRFCFWYTADDQIVRWSCDDGISFARATRIPLIDVADLKNIYTGHLNCYMSWISSFSHLDLFKYLKLLHNDNGIDLGYFAFPLLYSCGYRVRRISHITEEIPSIVRVSRRWELINIRPKDGYSMVLSFCRPAR